MKQGATRYVFFVGKYAIKIPSFYSWRNFLYGLLANKQEATFSKLKWEELCPVLFYLPLGFLVIMPRAAPITDNEYEDLDYEKFVRRKDGYIPVENKKSSFAKRNGKIVAVDYG